MSIEGVEAEFSQDLLQLARDMTWAAIERAAARIRPGMSEDEGRYAVLAEIAASGARRNWHPPQVRFGVNTLRAFGEPSAPGIILGENDIFFLDIGPIFSGYEADAGATFVLGQDPEMERAQQDVRIIHDLIAQEWRTSGRSGAALYEFAQHVAADRGWLLSLYEASGHRISEFPHHGYFKGTIADLDFRPQAGRWILEAQIRHPTRPFGAFYEDLLQ